MAVIKLTNEEKNQEILGVEDPNLSWKATGMLIFLLEATTEEFQIKDLVYCKIDGRSSCKSALKELEKNNYFYVFDLVKENKVIDTIYFVTPVKEAFTEKLKQEILADLDNVNDSYTLNIRNL